ncbi:Probable inactive 2-oxoglutarate-dependent dioxygenase AOP2 [Linum perenne]
MAAPTATAAGEIPFINLAAATANWRELCDKVREACETHGCFCLKTDEIPGELRDRMVAALSQLFDLPEDTKKRHVHPKPYRSYLGKNDVVPYLESFGIDHSPQLDEARAFSDLMWPHGNPAFRPKEEATIEVPKEFVDKEHPLLYRPFNYAEYLSYFVNKLGDDALEIYAGVSPIGIV